MAHIRLNNASISYPVFNSHSRSLRTAVFSKLGGNLVAHSKSIVVDAIKNLTLNLENGDRLALLGHNGAGKTTLLRALAGVYPPQTGTVDIVGRISSFTDITLGMDAEATGWDNIIFRCAFMGMSFTLWPVYGRGAVHRRVEPRGRATGGRHSGFCRLPAE